MMRAGPSYPRRVQDVMRDQRRQARDAFTAAATPSAGRPFIPWSVSCADPAQWAATTSSSFTALARATGWRSHPSYMFAVRVSAPALGSQARAVDSVGSVLWGPVSYSSGVSSTEGTIDLSSYDFYDDMYVEFQIRSNTSGQTSRLCLAFFAGYSP
jgi:hypothetical protein